MNVSGDHLESMFQIKQFLYKFATAKTWFLFFFSHSWWRNISSSEHFFSICELSQTGRRLLILRTVKFSLLNLKILLWYGWHLPLTIAMLTHSFFLLEKFPMSYDGKPHNILKINFKQLLNFSWLQGFSITPNTWNKYLQAIAVMADLNSIWL